MILLRQDADDNARVAARLLVENRCHFDDLNNAAVVVVRGVAPAGVTMEQCLCALTAWVMEVTNYDIRQGAARALAATQLWHGGLHGL